MRFPIRRTVIGSVAVFALALVASGQTPLGTAFTYQGRLENGGQAVNGPVNMVFKLYDAAALGWTSKWDSKA